ncbi:hypothetical protein MKW92_020928 [Papaver armeniacum]|nr:hypothetical protein MKW92_020928 [Papaver armeniacum]
MSGFVSTGKMSPNQDQSSEDSGAETKIDSFPGKLLDLSIKWLQPCLAELNNSIPGFGNFSDADKGKLIINRFLLSDMKLSCGGGHGMLPKDVHTLDGIILRDALVLQVNEIVDISYNPDHRFVGVPPGFRRTLMLSMTGGVQCVYGIEDRPIKDLQPCWFKGVVVDNVKVRDGYLMLEPGHLKVVNGMVEHFFLRLRGYWAVEKMDVMPSFRRKIKEQEEALLDSKELEEDAAVPKNRDPELAEKQSVGQQKEMAGNTFRGNTTWEADTTYEASLEQLNAIIAAAETTCVAAETTCETLLRQIQKIWDEVGQCEPARKRMLHQLKQECLDVCKRKVNETVKSEAQLEQLQHASSQSHAMDDECREILLQIQQECLNVYQRKFDQDKKSRDNLLEAMNLSKEKLISLASVLGEKFVLPNESAVMKKQISDIVIEIERLQLLKDAREEKFADVQSEIQKILEEIGGTLKLPEQAKAPTVDAKDLSLKALEALQTELLELQSARVKFHEDKKLLKMLESVFCEIRKEKMKGLEKEKEMTHIETDPDAARRKITSLFDNSEEMLGQVKNWMSACKLYSWLEDYNREENSYSSSTGADLNLNRVIEVPVAKTLVDCQTDEYAMRGKKDRPEFSAPLPSQKKKKI